MFELRCRQGTIERGTLRKIRRDQRRFGGEIYDQETGKPIQIKKKQVSFSLRYMWKPREGDPNYNRYVGQRPPVPYKPDPKLLPKWKGLHGGLA